jgi:membrane protein implicated in regulation of membrane protease activity
MNRVDAWLQKTPKRRLVLWFGFVLPLSVLVVPVALSDLTAYRAKAALVVAPILFGVAIWQGRKAYREIRLRRERNNSRSGERLT